MDEIVEQNILDWLRNRCIEFLSMKDDGFECLVWILTDLDSIWQLNMEGWRGKSFDSVT